MSYGSVIAADAPIHWWRCADASGNLTDAIGSWHLDAGSVGAYNASDLANDSSNAAVSFVSELGKSDLTNATIPALLSIECLVRLRDTHSNSAITGAWIGNNGAMISLVSPNALRFNTNNSFLTGPNLSVGQTYHVVATFDGTNRRLYVDGALVAGPTAGTAPTTTPATGWQISGYAGPNNLGLRNSSSVDEVALYDYVLSGAQIAAHYAASVNVAPTAPVVAGSTQGTGPGASGSGGNFTLTLPAGVVAGDCLVAFAAHNDPWGGYNFTFPAGWTTQLLTNSTGGNSPSIWVSRKIADGTEGASFTVVKTGGDPYPSAWLCHRITGAKTIAVAMGGAFDTGSEPNPAPLTPPWGAKDTLWIAAVSHQDAGYTVWQWPHGYTQVAQQNSGSGGSGICLASAKRPLYAATEDPGLVAYTGWTKWAACTVGFEPAAAAGGGARTSMVGIVG